MNYLFTAAPQHPADLLKYLYEQKYNSSTTLKMARYTV